MFYVRKLCLVPLCAGLALAGCQGTGTTVGPASVPNSLTFGTAPQPPSPPETPSDRRPLC